MPGYRSCPEPDHDYLADRPVRTPTNPRGLRDLPFELPEVSPAEKRRARDLLKALAEHYPDARCELNFSTPHELLIATILSAQATDAGVNRATPKLFAAFPTPADYAAASPEEIEPYIRSIGLFRSKAKAVHAAMTSLVELHGGEVPRDMDHLLALRGVARKTANVVLGNAFGINDGIPVDTHVQRLSWRLGLVPEPDLPVQKIERRLMALFPREKWCHASHLIIFHGRRNSPARGWDPDRHPIDRRFAKNRDR